FGAGGRTAVAKRLGGGATQTLTWLGRPTRRARLRMATTAAHNRKLANRISNKGLTVTPVDAALRKARRTLGTQTRRADSSRHVFPAEFDTRRDWLHVNWSRVSSKRPR